MTTETIGLTGIAALEAEMRDRLKAKDAEIERLRAALGDTARQRLSTELTDDECEHADFVGAYDIMIRRAREATAQA
jgi:hypothetical protein